MENINTQSQNEVKELLNEYVVTPLNDDISKTLSDMKEKIESLDETVKCEIVKISPTVNGNLDRLKKLLDKSFHFDDDEDAFEKICDDITDDIDAIIKEVKSLEDSINYIVTKIDAIQNVYTDQFSNMNMAFEQLKSDLIVAKDGIVTRIEQEIEALDELINEKTNGVSSAINGNLSRFHKLLSTHIYDEENSIEEIRNCVDEISEKISAINERIGKTQNLDTVCEQLTSELAIIKTENKKSKLFFVFLLSLGIANTIGIIAMLMLYLLK